MREVLGDEQADRVLVSGVLDKREMSNEEGVNRASVANVEDSGIVELVRTGIRRLETRLVAAARVDRSDLLSPALGRSNDGTLFRSRDLAAGMWLQCNAPCGKVVSAAPVGDRRLVRRRFRADRVQEQVLCSMGAAFASKKGALAFDDGRIDVSAEKEKEKEKEGSGNENDGAGAGTDTTSHRLETVFDSDSNSDSDSATFDSDHDSVEDANEGLDGVESESEEDADEIEADMGDNSIRRRSLQLA